MNSTTNRTDTYRRKKRSSECFVDTMAKSDSKLVCEEANEMDSTDLAGRSSFPFSSSRDDPEDINGSSDIDDQGRIVGGAPSEEHSTPWLCSLHHNGQFFCAGAIIHPSYVLTACHCFFVWKNKRLVLISRILMIFRGYFWNLWFLKGVRSLSNGCLRSSLWNAAQTVVTALHASPACWTRHSSFSIFREAVLRTRKCHVFIIIDTNYY